MNIADYDLLQFTMTTYNHDCNAHVQVCPWLQSANESLATNAVFQAPDVEKWQGSASWRQFEEFGPVWTLLDSATHMSKECVSLKTASAETLKSAKAFPKIAELAQADAKIKDRGCPFAFMYVVESIAKSKLKRFADLRKLNFIVLVLLWQSCVIQACLKAGRGEVAGLGRSGAVALSNI